MKTLLAELFGEQQHAVCCALSLLFHGDVGGEQHLVQLLSQFNRVPLSLCGKGFCVVWTKTNTPSPVMLRHDGHVIIGTVQGLGWTLLATRDV